MSDLLRDRIAAALASEQNVNLEGNGYDRDDLRALADAVIDMLGLYRVSELLPGDDGKFLKFSQYVTEWKADDE